MPIAWWPRDARYAERLAPGTKFADVIGEIDPARLAGGMSMSAEEALHFGLIPRMHRGIFAMNELPELDELVQVGLFNILEERDVQIRGYPVRFDIDVLILFSANPATYNRSGKVIPQLKDRIGSVIRTHYPRDRATGIEITQQEAGANLDGDFPVVVPYFMREIVEEISTVARASKYLDQQSGVSARLSIANYRGMVASARHRGAVLDERPAVPRISDLGHLYSTSLGKLEIDLMSSHQLTERQVLDAILAEAIGKVFSEYVDRHGLDEIAEIFGKGVKVEVGDLLPSGHYAERLKRSLPPGKRPSRSTPPAVRRCGPVAWSSCSPDSMPPSASPARKRTGRSSMRSPSLGGVIHTYQKYDPQQFPSPRQPAPDLVSGAFEHMLAFGESGELSEEELARLVRIDPRQIAGLGPSLESLMAMLRERKRKILETFETGRVKAEAREHFQESARRIDPPPALADRFRKAVAESSSTISSGSGISWATSAAVLPGNYSAWSPS